MTHTALGLFRNAMDAEQVVAELKAAGFTAGNLRVAAEPRYMPVSGPLSTPGMDFCEELSLDLRAMGVPEPETQAHINGVRNGGAVVFANGSIEQVERATQIMNRHHATSTEDFNGSQPDLPEMPHNSTVTIGADSDQAGRVRYTGSGARMFAW